MKRLLIRVARVVALSGALYLAWCAIVPSEAFQVCIEDEQRHAPPKTEEGVPQAIAMSAQRARRCLGAFIEANNAAITALATVVIAAFTITLWRATTEQGRLTKQALVADKRAFVFVVDLVPMWERDCFLIRNYNWRIRPLWKNSGETTTKGMRLHADCIVRDTPLRSQKRGLVQPD